MTSGDRCMHLIRRQKEPLLIAVVLFLCSLLIGTLCGRLFVLTMRDKVLAQFAEELNMLAHGEINYVEMFRYTLFKNAVIFLSILLATLCIIGPWYYLFRIGKLGLSCGMLAGQVGGIFHAKGILLMMAYYLPAWIVYAPAYIALYKNAYELWQVVFHKHDERNVTLSRSDFVRRTLILLLLLEFGAVLEVWLGSLLLRFAAGHFLNLLLG